MTRKSSRRVGRIGRSIWQKIRLRANILKPADMAGRIPDSGEEENLPRYAGPLAVLSNMEEKKIRNGWWCACAFLAVCLHAAPAAYALLAPHYGLPDVLEVNLETMNLFRDRVFREESGAQSAAPMELHPVQVRMQTQIPKDVLPSPEARTAKPEAEENLERIRIVQDAINRLWAKAAPEQPGYALVSLNILDNGGIGEFVVQRISDDAAFRTFLLSFLTTLKASYGNQAGPGESFWLECEFKVTPTERRKS